jgi:hypothetical protein
MKSKRDEVGCKEKCHNIVVCPKEEALKRVCQNRTVRFGKPEYPILTENFRTSEQCNKGFKVTLNKYMGKNESTKRQSKNKASRIKHQMCYIWYKGHLSKDCNKLKLSFITLSKLIYLMWNPKMTLALSRWLIYLVIVLVPFGYQNICWLTMKDLTKLAYQNLLDQVVGGLRCIRSLTIKEKIIQIAILSRVWTIIQIIDPMQILRPR